MYDYKFKFHEGDVIKNIRTGEVVAVLGRFYCADRDAPCYLLQGIEPAKLYNVALIEGLYVAQED